MNSDSALILVDCQNDFVFGSLAVKDALSIFPGINRLASQFQHVYATLDWHPPQHISFAKTHQKKEGETIPLEEGGEQILWPVHCVQNTSGAELVPELNQALIQKKIYKGTDPDVDSYSVFFDNQKKHATELYEDLRKLGIVKIFFAGLTTEYCVMYSAFDGKELGFEVFIIRDLCRPVNRQPNDEQQALIKMQNKGIKIIYSSDILY